MIAMENVRQTQEFMNKAIDPGREISITDRLKGLLDLQAVISNMVDIIDMKVRGPYPEPVIEKQEIKGYMDALSLLGQGYEDIAKRLDYLTKIM